MASTAAMIHTLAAPLRTVYTPKAVASVRPITTVPGSGVSGGIDVGVGVQLATTTIEPVDGTDTSLAPLVMLHGVLASSNTYSSLLKRKDLAPNRAKIALDLRNHGRSPHAHGLGMAYPDMAKDVSMTLKDLNIPRAVLCGHSMGGKVAMTLALQDPSLVGALIAVDIAPITYTPGPDPQGTAPGTALRAMRAVDLTKCKSRSDVDASLADNGITNNDVRAFIGTNLMSTGDVLKWKCNVEEIQYSLRNITGFPEFGSDTRYEGPTMLMRGGESNYVPFSAMKQTTSLFPKSKLVTINDAGHWLQAQRPDAFVQSVNNFLTNLQM